MFAEADLYGMPIVINDFLGNHCEWRQVHFPRSKKKRIRKKWAKNRANWKLFHWQDAEAYIFANETLVMNSTAYAALQKQTKVDPIQQAQDYQSAQAMMFATIAQSLNLPAKIFADDAAQNNYSSARLDMPHWKNFFRPY